MLSTRFDNLGTSSSPRRRIGRWPRRRHRRPDDPHETARLTGPAGQPYSAAFSPDGRHLIAGGSNSEIWVWSLDGDTPSEAMVIHSFPGNVYDVRFIGDGAFLASGAGGRVESWTLDLTR